MLKEIKRIAVITPNYPMPSFPERGKFVEKLVSDWQEMGILTEVVAPLSIANNARYKNRNNPSISIGGNKILRPYYLSLSNKKFGLIDFESYTRKRFINAALKGLKNIDIPDLYYGKFLLKGGLAALKAGQLYNRPSFADMGESNFLETLTTKTESIAKKTISSLSGIVCVSQRLKDEVIQLGGHPSKILLLANTADTKRFNPQPKSYCRQQLGLPQNAFIVAFTGRFSNRKGAHRVLKAIEMFREKDVYGVFFGRGPNKPVGKKVLHAAPVLNEDLPIWLSAADVFALPTTAEGNCNSINEAIACGVPIISSDIDDIKSQLPEGCGILVNPLDIQSLHFAIRSLKENRDELNRLSKNCKRVAPIIFNGKRGRIINDWMININSAKASSK